MAGYCVQDDVETWAMMGVYSATTRPTQAQVLVMLDVRAGEIHSWMAQALGTAAPGPAGYALTINVTTDRGLTLQRVCKLANAVGAAIDALQAAGAGESPGKSERVRDLMVMYYGLEDEVTGGLHAAVLAAAAAYAGVASYQVATHYSDGGVTQRSVESREELSPTFDHEAQW